MDTFGTKELYDCSIKTTYNLEIGGRVFAPGETVLHFDDLQISVLGEFKTLRSARGGQGNSELISWEHTDIATFACEKGVASKISMAIMLNSKLVEGLDNSVIVPNSQILESDINGKITLKYIPLLTEFFIYDPLGNAPTGYVINEKEITGLVAFTTYTVRYLFTYTGDTNILNIGQRLLNAATLKLTAKMRLKDDTDGHTTTGILEIPNVKLVSDLSMRLGSDVVPVVSTFRLQGNPVGERNSKYVCRIIYLDSDIDSET